MIKKILVANRGEIAMRVMRTCRDMGISSVAVFSDADRASLHVRYADEAYHIGPSPSNESYLDMDKIFAVAKESGADAIHPGYGFLSENADFSDRCKSEGIIFIGPSSEVISVMGDKISSREKMMESGVPVVPGSNKNLGDDDALDSILEIGLPVMLKASAGGGGKGMRLVRKEEDILSSLRAARSEAKSAFGDDTVYVEKFIESPHHIEFQILADSLGNVVHVCERECSVQRRHQKVVEETPSPLMTPDKREEMGQHAIAAAQSVSYEGAGTVEFLMDNDRNYYFLEMNTRLQVEHPITEIVTGVDLVKEQINIANGLSISFKQEDVVQHGHAIECRIYAEDPENNFMPSPGKVLHMTEPMGFGVRLDGYVYEGYEIPIYYDPMLAKLITWGLNREDALHRMKRALHEYKVTGIKTSIPFLERIMETEDFKSGNYDTGFIEKNSESLFEKNECTMECQDISMIVAYVDYLSEVDKLKPGVAQQNGDSGWKKYGRKQAVSRL